MTNLPTKLREKRDKKGFDYRKDPINNSYWDSDGCDPLDIFIDGYNQCFKDILPLVEAVKRWLSWYGDLLQGHGGEMNGKDI